MRLPRTSQLAVVCLLALSTVPLAACGGALSGGSTLVVDTSFDLKTADPARMYELTGQIVDHALYDTLLTFKGSDVTKPVPALAESYELSRDGKTVTLKLRHGPTFADGSPVTADDVVFSLERTRDLKGNPSFLLDGVTVTKVDDSTVTLVSKKPNPALPFILPNPSLSILNSKLVKAAGGTTGPDDKAESALNSKSAGGGPYVLDFFNVSTQVVLKANDKYWGPKPKYNRVVIRNVQSPTQKLNVQRGDSQLALDLSADQAKGLDKSLQVLKGPSAYLIYLMANRNPAVSNVTANPKFAEAVRKGVDYSGLLQLAGEGSVQPAGMIPSVIFGALPADKAMKRDVEGAKAALAGIPNPRVTLEYPTDKTVNGLSFQPLAERVQANLKEVGITVDLAPAPVNTALQNYRDGKEQMGLWYWGPDFPDPSNYTAFLPGELVGLRAGWKKGAAADLEAMGAVATAAVGDAERTRRYADLWTKLNEVGPFTPLIQPSQHAVAARSVTGLAMNPVWTVDVAALGAR